jgi:hypothetical protein
MEIQRLQVLVTEQDLQDLARQHLPPEAAVEDLKIHIEPDGVHVKGVYQMFVPVSFEALWALGVDRGNPTAKLSKFRTMGMPANVLKSLIMNVIADAAKKVEWLHVAGDTAHVEINELIKGFGLNLQTHLTAIRCQTGSLVVDGGMAEPGA